MSEATRKSGKQSVSPDRKEMLRQALVKIRNLQARLQASESAKRAPIAIVGMGCRYPGGANDPESFWQLLQNGVDAISEVPAGRWRAEDYYDSDPAAIGKAYVMQGGFLDDVESFDAPFFEISPTEARQMDPQQRLLLQVTWEALEHAGIAPYSLAGTPTGAFVGMTASDFLLMNVGGDQDIDTYLASGTSHAVAAGRLAYFLGLQGPAMTIDTACSAALLSVHEACQSLRSGECQTALAGGALLILSPFGHISACKGGMLSPTGRCKTFDASADGYVRAEGVAMLVLKRLEDAEADGDNVLAVIRGTASNQDGRSGGLTAPNGKSQEAVIKQALTDAGVSPQEITYVETHGTGTSLGDPIEVQALGAVHTDGRDREKPLLIGSVKTNIGHTEALAGVAGLMKVVLALQHRQIPPHLHCNTPNPHIPWADFPIRVARELTEWPGWAGRRLAGLSSFGFSGTNVHMIVEDAPDIARPDPAVKRSSHLLTLSGRSESALVDLASAYLERLGEDSAASVGDFCFSANTGRSHFEYRRAVLADSRDQLCVALKSIADGNSDAMGHQGKAQPNRQPMLAFLLPGRGSQYLQMGRDLYDTQATFRQALDACDALLGDSLDRSLLSVIFPPPDEQAAANKLLLKPRYSGAALFAVEWALAKLWQSWGVMPSMVMGEGAGEIAAACIAGMMGLDDGVRLVAARGRLLADAASGNATGDAAKAFANVLSDIEFSSPRVEMISSATGDVVSAPELSKATYWQDTPGSEGAFGDAVKSLPAQGCQAIIGVGPGASLVDKARTVLSQSDIPLLTSIDESSGDWECLLDALASLYVLGVNVDWREFDRDYQRRRVQLPTYPFEQTRYPIQTKKSLAQVAPGVSTSTASANDVGDIEDWFYELAWRPAERAKKTDAVHSQGQKSASWMVFADSQGIGESLRDLIVARGADVIFVRVGDKYERTGDREFFLRPTHAGDYERLVGEVFGPDHDSYGGIAHLWSLDSPQGNSMTTAQLSGSQSHGSTSVMLLVQALAVLQGHNCPRLWLATRGAQPVAMADRRLSVAQAPLWGLGRTIAAEHAELWGGLVDVDPGSSVSEAAGTLCDEVMAFDDEDQTVHRDGVRYVPQLLRNTAIAKVTGRLACRPDRAYLISGGLGGLGLEAARWLIRCGARRLILLGRTNLPERRGWNDIVASDPVAEKIAAVRELESLGASIHLAAADIANANELAAVLEEYRLDGWPPIGGVLHAAGTVEYGSLLEHDVAKLNAVMRAKILGGWLLHQHFAEADLEFFVLFSSAASIMNSPMLGGYAAANAFPDALAHFRSAQGLPGVCVNWGSWSETGMATRHDAGDRVSTGANALTISPRSGYEALERILVQSATQVVVLPIDWQQWSHLYSGLSRSSMFDALIGVDSGSAATANRGATPQCADGEDRSARLFEFVKQSVCGLLGLDEQDLDHDKRISQLGFDSLMAVQLKNKLEKEFGVVVPMAALLAGPTVNDLTSTLLDDLPLAAEAGKGMPGSHADADSEEGEL